MKYQFLLVMMGGIMSTFLLNCSSQPPDVQKQRQILHMHGHERIDNYYWLRERDNPQVIKYLEAENAYREKIMAPTRDFEIELFEEMKSRIKEDDSSVPAKLDDYWYYRRYEEGQEYPLYCRKKGSPDAQEEILLNVNELAQDQSYCHVSGLKTSPDHSILSYAVDFVGRREYTIRFKDLNTGQYLNDEIKQVTRNFVWANDNKTIFYADQHPETLRSEKIFKHILGQQQNKLVYFEEDETFDCSVGKTLSDEYLVIFNSSTLQTEAWILNANFPDGHFTPFLIREPEHEYFIEHGGDRWYILTNDNAKNFKVMQTPESNTAKNFWQDVVPHDEKTLLEDMTVFQNYLVLKEIRMATPHLRVFDRRSNQSHYIECDEPLYVTDVDENLEYDTDILRYSFESLKTPESIFDYHMQQRTRELKKQQP